MWFQVFAFESKLDRRMVSHEVFVLFLNAVPHAILAVGES